MKTQVFGVGRIEKGLLTLGSAPDSEGQPLRFRAAGMALETDGRVQFHAHLQELDTLGVIACMVTCQPTDLPEKVWVSARVDGGRIVGLGKTDSPASEVMGVLGGVFNEIVLLVDPIVPGETKKAKRSRRKKSGETGELPKSAGKKAGSDGGDKEILRVVRPFPLEGKKVAPDEKSSGSLHQRIEVLSPGAGEPFPRTEGGVDVLEGDAGGGARKGGRKRRDAVNESVKGSLSEAEAIAAMADPAKGSGELVLTGEDGEPINDKAMLF
jgi:hypothetical protein